MATKTTPLAAAATATASSFMSIAAACSSSAAAAIASSRLDDDDDDDSTMMTMMMMKQRLSLMVRTRPSTAMAEEFLFGGGNSKNIKVSWKSLPQRLRTLCNRLQNWNCAIGSPELSCGSFFGADDDDVKEARRVAMTAAVLAAAATATISNASASAGGVAALLYAPFESLFAASLHRRDCLFGGADENNDECFMLEPIFANEAALLEDLRTTGWMTTRRRDPAATPATGTTTTTSRYTNSISSKAVLYRPLMNAIQAVIYRKVKAMIAASSGNGGGGDTELLEGATVTGSSGNTYEQAVTWKNDTVEPWLRDLMGDDSFASLDDQKSSISDSLTMCTAECYCWVRLQEIFDLVTSFPDSLPAVSELRDVLDLTGMQSDLGRTLRDSLVRRLNHPGADTSQMIDVYISTIKVLRLIDPTDRHSLLSVTTEPVRAYLRGRSDTVRCIITSLTDADEAGGELYQELRRQDAKPLENVTADSDDEEECPTMNWQPPPPLVLNKNGDNFFGTLSSSARNTNSSRNGGDCDILAMLVSIYGSKELFVNEYRLMLADKLLANLEYNTDKEVHTLELLKLRFGEVSMVSAEVMIKDIEDSVRSNKNIRDSLRSKAAAAESAAVGVVDAAMISHIFWPKLQNEQLKHHPRIQAELDDFGNAYAELKNPRKLIWMNQLGTVQLELDVMEENADEGEPPHLETKEFICSPLLATLISHFEDKPTWTAEELSNETGVPEHGIQKRMAYWIAQRVVTFSSTSSDPAAKMEYTLSSKAERLLQGDHHHHHHQHGHMDDNDGHGGQAVSASAQEEEEMEVYESYISVMLTSLQQAPLERIHNMLHMMSGSGSGAEGTYNKTPQQLSVFLQHLCRQEKLECGPDGMYKLLKK